MAATTKKRINSSGAVDRAARKNPAQCDGFYSVPVKGYCVTDHCRTTPTISEPTQKKRDAARKKKETTLAKAKAKREAEHEKKGEARERERAEKREARERERAKHPPRRRGKMQVEDMTLSQFVRASGGIRPARGGANAGELRALSLKESGTTGLVNKKSRYTAESMANHAKEIGFFQASQDPNKFLEQVLADASGTQKMSHPERQLNPAGKFDAAAIQTAKRVVYLGSNFLKGARVKMRDGATGKIIRAFRARDGWYFEVQPDKSKTIRAVKEGEFNLLDRNPHVNGLFTKLREKVRTHRKKGKALKKATRAYKSELKLDAQIAGARAKRAKAEKEAHEAYKNPGACCDRDRKRTPKSNPAAPAHIVKLYREFLGREPNGKVRKLFTPAGSPADVAVIGAIEELGVGSRRLEFPRGALLGQSERGGHRRLYIGLVEPYRAINGSEAIKRDHALGEATYVDYWASKPHIESDNKLRLYRHYFGEEGGRKPRTVLTRNGCIKLVGGDYKTEKRGIVN